MSASDPLVPNLDDVDGEDQDSPVPVAGRNGTASTNADDENSNKFQRAITAWRNVDLTNLIPTLDATASELVTHQRDTLVDRKELAQKTKDWRKLDDAGKLTESKALLKAYQTYIDSISNHSKSVSSAFMNIYSSLSEAPDPYPLLEASVDSLIISDETVPKLESENRQLKNTTSRLTTQLETLEKQLETERAARLEVERNRDTKITEIEAKWSAVLKEKQDNWEAREKSLEEKADSQERLLKELKANYEVNQRMERVEGNDSNHQRVTTAELEIVSSDLERANTRLAEVESRNEQLRVELAQITAQSGKDTKANVEDEPSFLRLRSENSSLLRKIEAARLEREADNRKHETNARSLKKEVSALKQDTETMKSKLSKCSDYEDIKRELEVMKSIEFATGDNDELSQAIEGSAKKPDSKDKEQGQNLEQLLLSRNKKLNHELTLLRVSHQDVSAKLETVQEDLSTTNMELEKSRNLNVTLENDLSKMQSEVSDSRPAMSVAGTHISRYPPSSYGRRGAARVSPTSSIISGVDPSQAEGLRAGDTLGGGSSILPMITAQRDRFKKRISDLETEASKSYQTITSLRSEVAALQKDNLNLYEKSRYVSTYARGQPASSSPAYSATPEPAQGSDTSAPLDKYKSAYESRISPFAAFRGRESARAFKRMSLPERAFLQVTKVVLANRISRNLFAAYSVGLHVLVILLLYQMNAVGAGHTTMRPLKDAASGAVGAAGAAGLVSGNERQAGG